MGIEHNAIELRPLLIFELFITVWGKEKVF